jgi:hypothetical protein
LSRLPSSSAKRTIFSVPRYDPAPPRGTASSPARPARARLRPPPLRLRLRLRPRPHRGRGDTAGGRGGGGGGGGLQEEVVAPRTVAPQAIGVRREPRAAAAGASRPRRLGPVPADAGADQQGEARPGPVARRVDGAGVDQVERAVVVDGAAVAPPSPRATARDVAPTARGAPSPRREIGSPTRGPPIPGPRSSRPSPRRGGGRRRRCTSGPRPGPDRTSPSPSIGSDRDDPGGRPPGDATGPPSMAARTKDDDRMR